jgi:hypothetical protein
MEEQADHHDQQNNYEQLLHPEKLRHTRGMRDWIFRRASSPECAISCKNWDALTALAAMNGAYPGLRSRCSLQPGLLQDGLSALRDHGDLTIRVPPPTTSDLGARGHLINA